MMSTVAASNLFRLVIQFLSIHLYDHLVCAAVELCCVIIKGVLFIHLNFINKRSLNNKYSM